jgi:translation initiation factor 2B subunit (eIF-2B alpha/beta/delta family)
MNEIAKNIEEIRCDRLHGASWLSRRAIEVMKRAVEESESSAIDRFLAELIEIAKELMASRPSMVSITNCVSHLVYDVLERSKEEKELNSLRDFARIKADEILRDSKRATLKTIEIGADLIKERDRIMTCSYSSTVCQTFELAKDIKRSFKILVAESIGSDGRRYGKITADELERHGIQTEVISDDTIGDDISRVNEVLVGADSILADGSLINGTPTNELALAAKDEDIPLYSICETSKFDLRGHLELQLEEGFDTIPPHLIKAIITERGTIKPNEVLNWMKGMEKYIKVFADVTRGE